MKMTNEDKEVQDADQSADDCTVAVCPLCGAELGLPIGLDTGRHVVCSECEGRLLVSSEYTLICPDVKHVNQMGVMVTEDVRETQDETSGLILAQDKVDALPRVENEKCNSGPGRFKESARKCLTGVVGFVVECILSRTKVVVVSVAVFTEDRLLPNLTKLAACVGKIVKRRDCPKLKIEDISTVVFARRKISPRVFLILIVSLCGLALTIFLSFDNSNDYYQKGLSYYEGDGVEKDEVEAVKWYRKAAEQGHAEAQLKLGVCYMGGEGVAVDEVEAVKWYRKAAEQGQVNAQFGLGLWYALGCGVATDKKMAAKWFMKAAVQGLDEAQFRCGMCYANGEGVEKDQAEAVRWHRKAAEQGHAKAQYQVGLHCIFGEGVQKDATEGVKWLLKSADQGHADAQFTVGICYNKGIGVELNSYVAKQWIQRAAAQGHKAAINALEDGSFFE